MFENLCRTIYRKAFNVLQNLAAVREFALETEEEQSGDSEASTDSNSGPEPDSPKV